MLNSHSAFVTANIEYCVLIIVYLEILFKE